jgi:hypothetical protein
VDEALFAVAGEEEAVDSAIGDVGVEEGEEAAARADEAEAGATEAAGDMAARGSTTVRREYADEPCELLDCC